MKTLHIYAGNLFGGLENLLVSLAALRHLCPGIEPEFALCYEGRLASELRATGVRVYLLGGVRYSRPWTIWRARRRLRQVLASARPDVVLCHECWPHALAAPEVRRTGAALVFWMHGWVKGSWLERLARRYPPDLAIATSHYSASMLPGLFPDAPCAVVHPMVAAPHFDRQVARARTRAEFATPEGATVVAITSRLVHYKGHDLLLAALGTMRDLSGWIGWVAGAPQNPAEVVFMARLREQAAHLGIAERIRFLGARLDIPEVLAGADLHCQPNRGEEPFGMAFVEALYAGLPVLTTAIGGALEIVDESCGRLVPPDDPAALASALRGLLTDEVERRRLGEASPARARALCDPVSTFGLLRDALDAAVARKAG